MSKEEKIINALREALKETLQDSEIRCRQLGLDPEKYSTTIKANKILLETESIDSSSKIVCYCGSLIQK